MYILLVNLTTFNLEKNNTNKTSFVPFNLILKSISTKYPPSLLHISQVYIFFQILIRINYILKSKAVNFTPTTT